MGQKKNVLQEYIAKQKQNRGGIYKVKHNIQTNSGQIEGDFYKWDLEAFGIEYMNRRRIGERLYPNQCNQLILRELRTCQL